MKVYTTELTIVYGELGNLIQLSMNDLLDDSVKLSILDKEQEAHTGETSVEFESLGELKDIINDFSDKFVKITKPIKPIKSK
jgi:hypothetical protein